MKRGDGIFVISKKNDFSFFIYANKFLSFSISRMRIEEKQSKERL
jgi:hypothetical protein